MPMSMRSALKRYRMCSPLQAVRLSEFKRIWKSKLSFWVSNSPVIKRQPDEKS